jgi:hypothetical protein
MSLASRARTAVVGVGHRRERPAEPLGRLAIEAGLATDGDALVFGREP